MTSAIFIAFAFEYVAGGHLFPLDILPPAVAAKARVTGRIVQLPAHDAQEIEAWLAAVREAGLVAEDVEIRKADLEDVFLDVMADRERAGQGGATLASGAEAA